MWQLCSEGIEKPMRNGDRMGHFVNEYLVEKGRLEIARDPYDLVESVGRCNLEPPRAIDEEGGVGGNPHDPPKVPIDQHRQHVLPHLLEDLRAHHHLLIGRHALVFLAELVD